MSPPPVGSPMWIRSLLRHARARVGITLFVALVATATVEHHLLPEHAAMPTMAAHGHGAGHGETLSSNLTAAACIGVIESLLLVAAVGAYVRLRRRRPRPPADRRRLAFLPGRPPRAPPRWGPPPFLRLAVLRR